MDSQIHNYVPIVQHYQDRTDSYVGIAIETCPAFKQHLSKTATPKTIKDFLNNELVEYKNGMAICVKNDVYCKHFIAVHNTSVVCACEMTFLDLPDEK